MSGPDTLPIREKDSPGVNFLYRTVPGRCLLRLLICPGVSRALGRVLDAPVSRMLISPFIKHSGISLDDYVQAEYRSFNDFFTRQVKPGCRPLAMEDDVLMAPCDGKLTVYPITEQSEFSIKHAWYDLKTLLGDEALAAEFQGGYCLIFRLTPDDYHRYCYPDDGRLLRGKAIPGVLHTVRPVAFGRYPVYLQNAREYALLETENFGRVIQMEVGALFVGRIVNHPLTGPFRRGQEKGMFQFGGSTVILLLKKDAARIDGRLLENTRNNLETLVKIGQGLGHGKKKGE